MSPPHEAKVRLDVGGRELACCRERSSVAERSISAEQDSLPSGLTVWHPCPRPTIALARGRCFESAAPPAADFVGSGRSESVRSAPALPSLTLYTLEPLGAAVIRQEKASLANRRKPTIQQAAADWTMPSVRTSTSVTTTAPYTLPGPRGPEEDLRVDDPPLFRAEESPREPSVAPADSSEDNSSEFRRDFNQSVYECVRSIPEGKASLVGWRLPYTSSAHRFCRTLTAGLT